MKTIPKSSILLLWYQCIYNLYMRWSIKHENSYLNALITKTFGLICCFVNFNWAVYANAWSVKLISFIFNCCISFFCNSLFCFTVGVKGEWEKWRSYLTEVLGMSSHRSGLLSMSDVRFFSLFAGSCRILALNWLWYMGGLRYKCVTDREKHLLDGLFSKLEQCFLCALELS